MTKRRAPRPKQQATRPGESFEERVERVIRSVPRGRVTSYGQVAMLAGRPRNARQVGAFLRGLDEDSTVPWQRVVNASGRIAQRAFSVHEGLQRVLLEREGVRFTSAGGIDLRRYGWQAESRVRRGGRRLRPADEAGQVRPARPRAR